MSWKKKNKLKFNWKRKNGKINKYLDKESLRKKNKNKWDILNN